jgi:hypothetical protein
VSLGTSATASFVVDTDGVYPVDGTYIVHCVLNAGSPSQAIITVGLARLASVATADGRPLRKLGAGEVNEDTSVANRLQGYATMLDRWLTLLAAGNGGGANAVKCQTYSLTAAQIGTRFGHVATGTITLGGLPPGSVILSARLLIAGLFSGSGLTQLQFKLGSSGHFADTLVAGSGEPNFIPFFAIATSAPTPVGCAFDIGTEDPSAANVAAITLYGAATGGFLDGISGGILNVYVYYQ